ncbi:MAG: DivIVA domain-containing protein, partial [Lachnospiraceae bacterium]|nr:DivIVA domain-containing protein [Lachnospiraceae bacterium]
MLTPIDIHNRQLKPAKIGGYDKKDIDDFVEEIIASYEELYNENRVLKEKITSLSEGIQYYKKMEGTLQKALVLAEKTSTETQEAAKSQADSVITEASAKAEALSRETKAEIDALRAEAQAQAEVTRAKANRELEETRNHVRKLVQSYENYRLQFKKLAEAQIEMLESDSFSIFVPELDELMNEAPSADSVLDNPGVIPINIGSPAPFEEPPVETEAGTETAVPPKSAEKTAEQAAVEAVVEAHRKLDVKFDDLSNSIAIPISSNMGPFTDLPEEDRETDAAPLQDLKIDKSTAPSIDINIGTAIGEEIEVSMSLDPLPSSAAGNDNTIDILVNTQPLLSGSIDDIQAETADEPAPKEKPVVEQVAVSTPTPLEAGRQPDAVSVSLEQPA